MQRVVLHSQQQVFYKLEQVISTELVKEVCPAPGGGHWYHWCDHYRRVPHDYEFPNKVTLKNA